jgi:hypothetical protein
MRFLRLSAIVVLLLAGFLVALPGVAEVVDSVVPDGDCAEPCPGDNSEGDCSSACDECTCCSRAMSALLIPAFVQNASRRIEIVAPAVPGERPLVLVKGVFHPPRV